ncbi:hypothetical protein [Vibrio hepatarius]|uniref:hypothetical protein n=1 Tax=Vibrio hepatarius TaxID=171383 RepID=UPI003735C137
MINRKIVISLFMSFALVFVTGVAASAQTNELSYLPNDLSKVVNGQLHPAECPQTDHGNENISHHCCGSVCLFKMPLSQSVSLTNPLSASLALIGQDIFAKAVSRIQTLFRPPIA